MLNIGSYHQLFLDPFKKNSDISVKLLSKDLSNLDDIDIFLLLDSEVKEVGPRLDSFDRPSLMVVVQPGDSFPPSFSEGLVDDIFFFPPRELEVQRVLKMHAHFQQIRSIERDTEALPDLVKKLQQDVILAQKIQRRFIKEKFPSMGGFSIKSKYWCGLKSGGDYFDFFEFPDGNHIGMILTDSSSYSLSTNFIGSLMHFSPQMVQESIDDPEKIVSNIFRKLEGGIKEKEMFSIFFGIFHRKKLSLRFVDCGAIFAGLRGRDGGFQWITKGENPSLGAMQKAVPSAQEIILSPGDRIMLLSDGWAESLERSTLDLLPEILVSIEDPQDMIDSLAFQLRKKMNSSEESDESSEESDEAPMPAQDCSVLLLDLGKNVLRLAKG